MKSSQRPPLLLLSLLVLRLFWTTTATIGSEPAAREPSEIVYTTGQCAVACGAPVITNAQLKIHRTSGSYTPYQGKEFETWRAGEPSTALITGVKQTGWYQIEDHFNSESCTDQRDETMFVTVQNECTKGTYGFPLKYNYNLKATDYNLNGNKALMVRDADNYVGNNNRMCSTDNDCSGREAMWVGETLVSQWGCKDQSSHGKCCSPKNPVVIGTFLLLKDKCELGTSGCSNAGAASNNRITIFSGCIDALYNRNLWRTSPSRERNFFTDNFCTTDESVHLQAGNIHLSPPECPGPRDPCLGVTCPSGKRPVVNSGSCLCQCILDASSCTAALPNFNQNDCSCYCPLSNNQACATQNGNNPNFIKKKDGSCGCECGLSTAQCQSQLGPNAVFNPTSCSCSCPIGSNQDCVNQKLSPWYEKTPGSCDCRCTLTDQHCRNLNGVESMFKADGSCSCDCPITSGQWCKDKFTTNWGKSDTSCACECKINDAKCQTQLKGPYAKADTKPEVCNCYCPLTDAKCAEDKSGNTWWKKKTNGDCGCQCTLTESICKGSANTAEATFDAASCSCKCPLTSGWCQSTYSNNDMGPVSASGACACECKLRDADCVTRLGGGYAKANSNTCKCECPLTDAKCAQDNGNNAYWKKKANGNCGCECSINEAFCHERFGSESIFSSSSCSCTCPIPDDAWCQTEYGPDFGKVSDKCECGCELTTAECQTRIGPDAVLNRECECECPLTDALCAESKGDNTNWKKQPDSCECQCTLTEESCAEGYRLNPDSCTCDCFLLTDEVCQEVQENFVVDKETECRCKCGLSAEACAALGVTSSDEEEEEVDSDREEVSTSGFVFQESTCSCIEQSDGGGGITDGEIVGGVLGSIAGVAALGLGAAAVSYFVRKKRKAMRSKVVAGSLATPASNAVVENPIFNPATTIVSSELYAAQ
ncbi:hypothetical protein QOT17_011879 [Balamuthia mandrillaris]